MLARPKKKVGESRGDFTVVFRVLLLHFWVFFWIALGTYSTKRDSFKIIGFELTFVRSLKLQVSHRTHNTHTQFVRCVALGEVGNKS